MTHLCEPRPIVDDHSRPVHRLCHVSPPTEPAVSGDGPSVEKGDPQDANVPSRCLMLAERGSRVAGKPRVPDVCFSQDCSSCEEAARVNEQRSRMRLAASAAAALSPFSRERAFVSSVFADGRATAPLSMRPLGRLARGKAPRQECGAHLRASSDVSEPPAEPRGSSKCKKNHRWGRKRVLDL